MEQNIPRADGSRGAGVRVYSLVIREERPSEEFFLASVCVSIVNRQDMENWIQCFARCNDELWGGR